MISVETVSGQQRGWSLVKKLGEGDAGEVYLVAGLLDKQAAILKRPHRSTFSSDILRQASQIEAEGRLLRALSGLAVACQGVTLGVPALLDQSPPGAEFSERLFIVIKRAPGFDLNLMARAARFGLDGPDDPRPSLPPEAQQFLFGLAERGAVPPLVLLRALCALLELFEKIHSMPVIVNGVQQAGVLWNDVKPEHLFWDPGAARFTVIDWGNGQFLESDGATRDRRNSRMDDYMQLFTEMGRFLSTAAPELHQKLKWPVVSGPTLAYMDIARALKKRIISMIAKEMEALKQARQAEADLLLAARPGLEHLEQLDTIQDRLAAFGEQPDDAGAERFCSALAGKLVDAGDLAGLQAVCRRARRLPGAPVDKWLLLEQIAQVAAQGNPPPAAFFQALFAGLGDDWNNALWELFPLAQGEPQPAWWDEISARLRQVQLQLNPDALTPYVAVSRLAHMLHAAWLKLGDSKPRAAAAAGVAEAASGAVEVAEAAAGVVLQLRAHEKLVRALRDEVLKKWRQPEPDPPDAGLAYTDLERLLEDIGALAPANLPAIQAALEQPQAQVKVILDAWSRKEFELARRGLRRLLLWDPDRQRVWLADHAIGRTPAWLEKVHLGPQRGEGLPDFIARLELAGRELRNQVGPARWLDLILESLTSLRKGKRPSELLIEHPELANEMAWLHEFEPRQPLANPATAAKTVKLERAPLAPPANDLLKGIHAGGLGPDRDLMLADSLDTWAPEARGSSARVFMGFLRSPEGNLRQSAIKIMRAGHADYALPLFREEVRVLTLLRDVPGVTGLLECGFLRLAEDSALPGDDSHATARALAGELLRYGALDIAAFLQAMPERISENWLPYLALEKRNRAENLMMLCDAGYTRGRLLPVKESLRLAIQICDILNVAHSRNIVYRDHKILHYYWDETHNGVFVIDWNVARYEPQGLSKAEKQFDLVQFAARALHHIVTGRSAPGALPLGPTRPEEIEAAARSYRVHWTYDDQRLPPVLKDLLERALAGGYADAGDLRDDLEMIFLQTD